MAESAVVIVNYNGGTLLIEAAQSALAAGASQVVVVDNASQDNSLEVLAESVVDARLMIVRNGANLGFAQACNRGYRASRARSVLFLNPDGRLEAAALNTLEAALFSADDVGMVGPLLLNPDGTEQRGGRRKIPTPMSGFAKGFGLTFLARVRPGYFSDFNLNTEPVPEGPTEVEALSGGCMLVRRSTIDAVGGWDEGYFLHVEDIDICVRVRQAGWRLLFVPDAVAVHVKGASSKAVPIFVEWHKHRGMIRFYEKFHRQTYPWPVMLAVKVGVWLRFGLVASYLWLRRWLSGLT